MYWDSATLKAWAKNVLRFSYWKSVLADLVAGAISYLGAMALGLVMVFALVIPITGSALAGRGLTGIGSSIVLLVFMLVLAALSFLFKILVANPLEAGLARYYSMSRFGDARIENVFFSFKKGRYGNIVKALFLRDLYLFLWTLLISSDFLSLELLPRCCLTEWGVFSR